MCWPNQKAPKSGRDHRYARSGVAPALQANKASGIIENASFSPATPRNYEELTQRDFASLSQALFASGLARGDRPHLTKLCFHQNKSGPAAALLLRVHQIHLPSMAADSTHLHQLHSMRLNSLAVSSCLASSDKTPTPTSRTPQVSSVCGMVSMACDQVPTPAAAFCSHTIPTAHSPQPAPLLE